MISVRKSFLRGTRSRAESLSSCSNSVRLRRSGETVLEENVIVLHRFRNETGCEESTIFSSPKYYDTFQKGERIFTIVEPLREGEMISLKRYLPVYCVHLYGSVTIFRRLDLRIII